MTTTATCDVGRARHADTAGLRMNMIAAAVLAAFSPLAIANPEGMTVVHGQASATQNAGTLTITNAPGSILNWQSFSIGAGETTRFVQQDAHSAVLNRVVGQDPSAILGTLSSNGQVFLLNPNGILFGQNARVDVAGLVASTLDLSDQDFLAGRLNFSAGAGTGTLRNEGTISSSGGGSVYLVASEVTNTGTVDTPAGQTVLAASTAVRLGDTANPGVLVELEAADQRVTNLGTLSAAGGGVNIYAGVIDQRGVVRAGGAAIDAAGRVRLVARHDVTLAAGSETSAAGAAGGEVRIDAESGTLLAAGQVLATGASAAGGHIALTGNQVGLTGTATADASGATGGGTILVGGDYRGENPAVRNARAVFAGADTTLRADAGVRGDGGRVILWSDEATRVHGEISARGGAQTGNGGFVETSSKGYLDVTRTPDVGAANGRGGEWLLDPGDLTVIETPPGTLDTSGPALFEATGAGSTISNDVINQALDLGTAVTLDTGLSATGGSGDLTVLAPIVKSSGAATSLTLNADNRLLVLTSIRDDSGAGLDVNLNAGRGNPNGDIFVQGDGVRGIVTGPGNLSLNAGGSAATVLANELYAIGGTLFATGTLQLSTNAVLQLGGGSHTVNNLVLDPNAGGGLTIRTDTPGTLRTLDVGGSLQMSDLDASGAGNITINEVVLEGTSATFFAIPSTIIDTHTVNLNSSTLQTNNFAMLSGTLGSNGRLFVNQNFLHGGGTIDFGTADPNTFIDISDGDPSLVLSQPLTAHSVSIGTPFGAILDGNGAATNITAVKVSLSSCGACSVTPAGGIGTAADPLDIQDATSLSAQVDGFSTAGIYLDHRSGGAPVQIDGLVNNTAGGSVNLRSDGDIALADFCPDGCEANIRTQGGDVNVETTGAAASIGQLSDQGLIDTTPFPSGLSQSGGNVTLTATGDVNVFAISTAASQAISGSGANGGNVTINAGGTADLINITARGADGALFSSTGANGGAGGAINITAGGAVVGAGDLAGLGNHPFSGGFSASGGNGGADLSGNGGAGGAGGSIQIAAAAPSELARIEARGGDGGSFAQTGAGGGNGGQGGTIDIIVASGGSLDSLELFDPQTGTFLAPELNARGGQGGNADLAATPGSGGHGGDIFAAVNGNLGLGWSVNASGGSAGLEGTAVNPTTTAGNGGTFSANSAGTLNVGPALHAVPDVFIDVRGGTNNGTGSPLAGTVALHGTGGVSQGVPLVVPGAVTTTITALAGAVNLDLANSVARITGGTSTGDFSYRSSGPVTFGPLDVGGTVALSVASSGNAAAPNRLTVDGVVEATGDIKLATDDLELNSPNAFLISGTGAGNFIEWLPLINAPQAFDAGPAGNEVPAKFSSPTFRIGSPTTPFGSDIAFVDNPGEPGIQALVFPATVVRPDTLAVLPGVTNVSIFTTGTVTQPATGGAPLQLLAAGAGGQITAASIALSDPANIIPRIAGSTTVGGINVATSTGMTVGSVDGVTGLDVPTGGGGLLDGGTGNLVLGDGALPAGEAGNWSLRTASPGQVVFSGTNHAGVIVIDAATSASLQDATLNLSGSGYINNGATTASGTASTINGTLINNGSLAVSSGTLTIAQLIQSSVSASLAAGAGTLDVSGLLDISGGSIASGSRLRTGTAASGTLADVVVAGNFDNQGATQLNNVTLTGSATNAGTLNVSGTSNLAALANSGVVSIGPGSTAVGTLTHAGGALVGSGGSLDVGSLTQSGTLSVSGSFDNLRLSGTGALALAPATLGVIGNLDLAGSALTLTGVAASANTVAISAPTVDIAGSQVAAAGNMAVSAGSTLTVDGTSAAAKLLAGGVMTVSAGTVNVIAGAHGASIDPIALALTATGDLNLTGGSTTGASAEVFGDTASISAANITLIGGNATDAYARIAATAGNLDVTTSGQLLFAMGSGVNADAILTATGGTATVTASTCTGCTTLTSDPTVNTAVDGGAFATSGVTFNVATASVDVLPAVDNSIIFATDVASNSGEGTATNYTAGASTELAAEDTGPASDDDEDTNETATSGTESTNRSGEQHVGIPACN